MKVHTLLGISLACLAASATAQTSSVTLYGIVDAGLEYAKTGSRASALRIESGLLQTSRWGLRGSEDLGGGVSAIFTLEAEVRADTGASAEGFARQSFMGLQSSKLGSLTLGRHYTPEYFVLLNQSVFGFGLAGKASNHAVNNTTRQSNSASYISARLAGFRGSLMLGAGNENFAQTGTSPRTAGRYAGASVDYLNGPLTAAVSYGYQKATTTLAPAAPTVPAASTIEIAGGATYNFGIASLNAGGYRRSSPAGFTGRSYWVGANVKLGAGDFLAQVSRINDTTSSNRDATLWALGYVYPMSRRTALYASFGLMSNNANANYGIAGAGNDAPDASVRELGYNGRSLMLGMRHAF